MYRYCVFDIETTGLELGKHHRIVEIAVVLVDDRGEVGFEWETLINPKRHVDATDIHGLTASNLFAAPEFVNVAGKLASLMRGRVPVAHNLTFDSMFIANEFKRTGYDVPLSPTNGLCTMRLASRYLN